jgi:hypothetical protein
VKQHVEVAMEFELKDISPEAVPRALEKAERYRLLNEPGEAESICRDVLKVDPDNQDALRSLILALTEQFHDDASTVVEARAAVGQLRDDYERAYFAGIVAERRAKARLRNGMPGCGPQAYEWLRDAMNHYDKAEGIRPAGNDDARLRWNACARLIMHDHQLVPIGEDRGEPLLLE